MRPARLALAAAALAALACGGLPAAAPDVPAPNPDAAAPEVVLPTAIPADAVAPADPYATFAPLDAGEQPPPTRDPACPTGSSVIRYPRGPALEVYCATTQGMKDGPWQRAQGGKITELREYDDGKQVGRAVRWERGLKIAESGWVDGLEEGDVAEWNDAGILMLRGTMRAGKRHGKFLLRAPAAPDAFDGRCFADGAEAWATTDPADFVARACP